MYLVELAAVPVGAGLRVRARETEVGEIVPREMMAEDDGALTEAVRREGPTAYSILEVSLHNLENP